MLLDVSNYNISEKSNYFAVLPVELLQETYSFEQIPLNITSFTIPERQIPTADVQLRGQDFYYPQGIQKLSSKQIDISILLSSSWIQYWFLNQWMDKIVDRDGKRSGNFTEYLIDFSIYKLSEFKKPLAEIIFQNAWLSTLGSLEHDQSAEDELLTFTLTYSGLTINFDNIDNY